MHDTQGLRLQMLRALAAGRLTEKGAVALQGHIGRVERFQKRFNVAVAPLAVAVAVGAHSDYAALTGEAADFTPGMGQAVLAAARALDRFQQSERQAARGKRWSYTSPTEHADVLGIKWPSTSAEIDGAYRARAKETHPDMGGNPAEFKAVHAAWERLSKLAA